MAQIVSLIESSVLRYDVYLDSALKQEPVEYQVLPNSIYVDTSGGGWELKEYVISDSASQLAALAEEAFRGKEYDKALGIYQELARLEPSFHYALTLIGDTYLIMGKRDSAIAFLQTAPFVGIPYLLYIVWLHFRK